MGMNDYGFYVTDIVALGCNYCQSYQAYISSTIRATKVIGAVVTKE